MKQTLVFSIALAVAGHAAAADRQRIRVLNVSLQPLLTLASAALHGRGLERSDIVRCLGVGAGAGYAFYQSKRLAGDGHTGQALVIANLAASMTRNVAAGRGAFSRIGLTFGPTWTEVSTPLDNTSGVHVELSVSDTVAGAMMWHRSNRLMWRDGLLAFGKHGTYDYDHRHFRGYTIGVFPGTTFRTSQVTWHHETIHVIQAIQADALEPPACAWLRKCDENKPQSWFQLKLGVLPAVGGGLSTLPDYPDRWNEIEATRLAEHRKPQ